jgi:hypothetical protein
VCDGVMGDEEGTKEEEEEEEEEVKPRVGKKLAEAL